MRKPFFKQNTGINTILRIVFFAFCAFVILYAKLDNRVFAYEYDFNDFTSQSNPAGWNFYSTGGKISPVNLDSEHGVSLKINSDKEVSYLSKKIDFEFNKNSVYCFSYEIYLNSIPTGDDSVASNMQTVTSSVSNKSQSETRTIMYGFRTDNGTVKSQYINSGNLAYGITDYENMNSGKWYCVDIIADFASGTQRYYLDGVLCRDIENFPVENQLPFDVGDVSGAYINFSVRTQENNNIDGGVVIDNVKLYEMNGTSVTWDDNVGFKSILDDVAAANFNNSIAVDSVTDKSITVDEYDIGDILLQNPIARKNCVISVQTAQSLLLQPDNMQENRIYKINFDNIYDLSGKSLFEQHLYIGKNIISNTRPVCITFSDATGAMISVNNGIVDSIISDIYFYCIDSAENQKVFYINNMEVIAKKENNGVYKATLAEPLLADTKYYISDMNGEMCSFTTAKPIIEIKDISFCDSNNTKIGMSSVLGLSYSKLKVSVANSGSSSQNAVIVAAGYKNKTLIGTLSTDVTLNANSLQSFYINNAEILFENELPDYIECFVVNSFDNMVPLTANYKLITEVSASPGMSDDFDRLKAYSSTDDNLTVVQAGGNSAWLLEPENKYINFDINDNVMYNITDGKSVIVEVDYFDSGMGNFTLEYDGLMNMFSENKHVQLENKSNEWKTAKFYLSNPRFANRLDGADFRISLYSKPYGYSANDVIIGDVRVIPLLTKDIFNISIESNNIGNIFFSDQSLDFSISLDRKFDYDGRTLRVKYTVTDINDNFVTDSYIDFECLNGNDNITEFTVEALPYGLYKLIVEISGDGVYSKAEKEFSIARTDYGETKNSHLGVMGPSYYMENIDLINNAGFSIQRSGLYMGQDTYNRYVTKDNEGNYTISGNKADELAAYKEKGMGVMAQLHAYNGTEFSDNEYLPLSQEGLDKYAEYCKSIVATHSPYGINDYEVWNEWDINKYNADDVEYINVLKTGYNAVKELDPAATVIGGVSSGADTSIGGFLNTILKNGAGNYMDVLSIHPYSSMSPILSDRYGAVKNVRSLLDKYGFYDMPIWATEMGFATNFCGDEDISSVQQGAYLAQTYAMFRENNIVDKMFIFCFSNRGLSIEALPVNGFDGYEDRFGMVNYRADRYEPYAAKPAYLIISNMNLLLADAKYIGKIKDDENGVYIYGFHNDKTGKDICMAWSLNDDFNTEINFGGQYDIDLYDTYGNRSKLTLLNGKIQVVLGECPVYFEGTNIFANIIDNYKTAGVTGVYDIESFDNYSGGTVPAGWSYIPGDGDNEDTASKFSAVNIGSGTSLGLYSTSKLGELTYKLDYPVSFDKIGDKKTFSFDFMGYMPNTVGEWLGNIDNDFYVRYLSEYDNCIAVTPRIRSTQGAVIQYGNDLIPSEYASSLYNSSDSDLLKSFDLNKWYNIKVTIELIGYDEVTKAYTFKSIYAIDSNQLHECERNGSKVESDGKYLEYTITSKSPSISKIRINFNTKGNQTLLIDNFNMISEDIGSSSKTDEYIIDDFEDYTSGTLPVGWSYIPGNGDETGTVSNWKAVDVGNGTSLGVYSTSSLGELTCRLNRPVNFNNIGDKSTFSFDFMGYMPNTEGEWLYNTNNDFYVRYLSEYDNTIAISPRIRSTQGAVIQYGSDLLPSEYASSLYNSSADTTVNTFKLNKWYNVGITIELIGYDEATRLYTFKSTYAINSNKLLKCERNGNVISSNGDILEYSMTSKTPVISKLKINFNTNGKHTLLFDNFKLIE